MRHYSEDKKQSAEFGVIDSSDPESKWMPYREYIFQQKFYELRLKYFPYPIPKEFIEELEKEYVNSKG